MLDQRPTSRSHLSVLTLVAVLIGACHTFAYHDRSGAPAFQKRAIDYHKPHSTVRWSYWWGLTPDEWTPIECRERSPDGKCTRQIRPCDNGVGRVETSLTPYTVPLMILTLGIAVPMRVTAYCSTDGDAGGPVAGP